jgi:hypothetical protein
MARLLLCGLIVGSVLTAGRARGGEALPADLAFVPADAAGFVHVRIGDVWRSGAFKEWRETILKAGDQALAAFDKRFIPAPSSIDRVTVFLRAPLVPGREPDVVIIVATTKAIDRDGFLLNTIPNSDTRQAGGKTYNVDPNTKTAIHFINERTLAIGPVAAVETALTKPAARQGPLADALRIADAGKPLVVALSAAVLPPAAINQVPPQFQALAQAKLATLTLDMKGNGRIDLRLTYASEREAADAEEAVHAGIKLGRMFIAKGRQELEQKIMGNGGPGSLEELPEAAAALVALGVMNRVEEFLVKPPLKKKGSALQLTLELPPGGPLTLSMSAMSVGLLLPAVQKVREAALRTQDMNNLKQIGLAMYMHHDAYRRLPAAAICDKDGKPLLSWRVAILPFIEQPALYKQFKLDEPWDSEHNRKLIPLMPKIYAIPAAPPKPGETHYRVFVGKDAAFDLSKPARLPADFVDGTSNTILVAETADSVVWTKPDDINYDPQKPLPKLFQHGNVFLVLLGDGSVRAIPVTLSEKTLRAAITRAGGEILGPDW